MEAKFHVFVALALLVGGCQISFVVAVGRADDFCGGESAAGFGPFVASWQRIGVDCILSWVVSSAVGAVEGIKEVIEGGAFDVITGLIEGYWLWVYERHGVFEVEVGFTIVFETLVGGLDGSAVNKVSRWGFLDLLLGVVGKEEIQVPLEKRLRCVLDNAVYIEIHRLASILVKIRKSQTDP